MRRVLVTGSRSWSDDLVIYQALDYQFMLADDVGMLVIHGQASGADQCASQWVANLKRGGVTTVDEDPHPAHWDQPCGDECHHVRRRYNGEAYYACAGHVRNQEMVDLKPKADVCLAFPAAGPKKNSPGTWDCVGRVKKACIPEIVRKARVWHG